MSPTFLIPVLREREGAIVLPVCIGSSGWLKRISLLTLLFFLVDYVSLHNYNKAKFAPGFCEGGFQPTVLPTQ